MYIKTLFSLLSKYRTVLMGIAAIWILIFHEWNCIFGAFPILGGVERFVKRIGFCGVDIFLLLSGMGLTFSIKKNRRIGSFYCKRLKRIVLPFIFMALIKWGFGDWTFYEFLINITGFKFFTETIYGFLWFVPAICCLYFIFPFYWKLFEKAENKFLFTICSIEIWLIASLFLREILRVDLWGFTNRIPVFLVGILFGYFIQKTNTDSFGYLETKINMLIVCITLGLGLYLSYLTNYKNLYIVVPVSNCCIPTLLISSSLPFVVVEIFELMAKIDILKDIRKVIIVILSFLGEMSLEIYCVQEWLGLKLVSLMEGRFSSIWINFIVFGAAIVCGWLLHILCKKVWTGWDHIKSIG